jgi:hypothetical protein
MAATSGSEAWRRTQGGYPFENIRGVSEAEEWAWLIYVISELLAGVGWPHFCGNCSEYIEISIHPLFENGGLLEVSYKVEHTD